MGGLPVTLLISALFIAVCVLLAYGARAFRRGDRAEASPGDTRVNMRREVLWTTVSAGLLLAIFVMVR